MIGYNNEAPKAVNNVGQFGATEGTIGAYKSAAEYAADAKYWALLSQTKYSSVEEILAEVERLYAQGRLLEEDIKQLKSDFESQEQVLLGLIQSTGTAIDNTNAATELSKEATQNVLAQLDIISNMTVQTTLLPPGSLATGSYDNSTGVFSFGIPEGQPGRDGTDGSVSDIGSVPVGTPSVDDYGFYVDKVDGGLYRSDMSEIANLIPSVRSVSINEGPAQIGEVVFDSVTTFNGRKGLVTPASGDYTVSQITGAAASGDNSDITSLSGLSTALSISQGGTGAKTAADARTNLGLGSVATESIVPITKGGTGASTDSAARTNLGLGLVATESIVPITKGGTGATSSENARLALVAAKSGENSDITKMTQKVSFTQSPTVPDAVEPSDAVNKNQLEVLALKKDQNLLDLLDIPTARDNISVYSKDEVDKKISRLNVLDFGADPTGVSDSAEAFQEAIDFASDKLGSSGHGVALYIPGGVYSLGSTIRYTWRSSLSQDLVNDGDTRRLVIIGDGSSTTFLRDVRIAPGPTPLFEIDGGSPLTSPASDPHLRFYMFGVRFQRASQDRQGWGLLFKGCSIFKFEQVDLQWFSNALVGRDLIQGVISHCQFGANELGVSLERGTWTNPNVLIFDHVMFGGNNAGCAFINDGANVKFTNCTFEGTVTSNRDTSYCIRYTGAPSEGGVGLTVDNCYFENNNVRSDILIANDTTSSVGTHLIRGNSFQRTSSTSYCVNHIETRNSIGLNGKFKVSISGNSFKLFGHPHVSGNNSILSTGAWGEVYDDGSNNYESSEKPNYSDIGGASGYSNAIVAAGKVASSGIVISGSYNLASVVKSGIGVYDISFTKSLSSELSFPTVTLQDSQAYAITSAATVDGIRVSTFSSGGTPVDSSFNIVIVGIK